MHANSIKILPQEICGLICQDPILTRRDLFSLCAVSRAFRDESERFLYTSARLRGTRKIKSFCVSVIRRPFLAVRLRQLVLYMPPQLDLEVGRPLAHNESSALMPQPATSLRVPRSFPRHTHSSMQTPFTAGSWTDIPSALNHWQTHTSSLHTWRDF